MSTRTRQKANTRLIFSEKLIKGHSTEALLKKLKTLHGELSELEQETVDSKSLGGVRKELIHSSILLHKDRGVRVYAACCLADLLRLYAPDAPYTAAELRDIFQFFIRQLAAGLSSPDAPYYTEFFYLMESLASIKSVVLVCDLPQSDELMTEFFREFFDLIRHDTAKNVELHMADILVAILDEADTVPLDLLEVILAQFLQKDLKTTAPSYRLAVEVCKRTSSRLHRNVSQYFTDAILQSDDDDEVDRAKKAHDLVKALNRHCSSLLLMVIPQLEEELKLDRLQLRTLSTQTLGDMFGDPQGGLELSRKHHAVWSSWLQRRNDKAVPVRLAFVEATKRIFENHADLRSEIEDALRAKLLDVDDKVRATACHIYTQLDYEMVLHHVTLDQLKEIASRCLDKKGAVRKEAFTCLGRLFALARLDIDQGEPLPIAQFGWIPNYFFKSSSVSPGLKSEITDTVYTHILPLPEKGDDEQGWTRQLLNVAKTLEESAMRNLLAIAGLKASRPTSFSKFLDICTKYNGGIMDKDEDEVTLLLNKSIKFISGHLPDASRAANDLHEFAKANDQSMYRHLRTCANEEIDLNALIKSLHAFLRRLEQTLPHALSTMMQLLRLSILWVVNQSSIPTLFKELQRDDAKQSAPSPSEIILRYISKHHPILFKHHLLDLTRSLSETRSTRVLEVGLQALAALVRADAPSISNDQSPTAQSSPALPTDKRTFDRLKEIALGNEMKHAKYAARILAFCKSRQSLSVDIMNKLADDLSRSGGERVCSHLAVFTQFALHAPKVFELRSEEVVPYVVNTIILKPGPEATPDNSEWINDADVDPGTRARLLGMKMCTNRCLSQAEESSAYDVAQPVLQMLWTLLENGGAVSSAGQESLGVIARIRLQASLCLLKLSTKKLYCKTVIAKLVAFALTVQDTSFFVRNHFLSKLINYLSTNHLDARFHVVVFLTAHDPDKEIKDKARTYAAHFSSRSPKDVKASNFELIFIRLLHLLAHHPDFSTDDEGLKDLSIYIEYFLDLIASSDNVSLLYNLAAKLKTVRDVESNIYDEHLYVLSELAQQVISARCHAQSWTIPSFPGKIRLPSDIFKPHGSAAEAKEVMTKIYLPKTHVLPSIASRPVPKAPTHKPSIPDRAPRKRKDPSGTANTQSKRRRRTAESDMSDVSTAMDSDEEREGQSYEKTRDAGSSPDGGPRRRSARNKPPS